MEPSEVRARILGDHERLRGDLELLEGFANEILEGIRIPIGMLRADAEDLVTRLRRHMQWEESYLLPALSEADAWGAERAARLRDDHREQRELLDLIVARLRDATRPPALVARDVAQFVELLREDMRQEEDELLDERVLRDDVVAVDMVTD